LGIKLVKSYGHTLLPDVKIRFYSQFQEKEVVHNDHKLYIFSSLEKRYLCIIIISKECDKSTS